MYHFLYVSCIMYNVCSFPRMSFHHEKYDPLLFLRVFFFKCLLFDTWVGYTDLFLSFPFQNSKPQLPQTACHLNDLVMQCLDRLPDEDTLA